MVLSNFVSFKKHLAGEQFTTDVDVKQAVISGYSHLTPIRLLAVVPLWDKCLYVSGDHVEV